MTTPLNPAGVGYTPGRWEVQDDHQGIWINSASLACRGIAYTANYCGNEQRIANARLIAAAPDLLAALVAAESLFAHTFAQDGTIHKQMRAAISRATGDA